MNSTVEQTIDCIVNHAASKKRCDQSLSVAITGIDGSGKSFLSEVLFSRLSEAGLSCAILKLDLWHQPSYIRFAKNNPGENYYLNAYKFNDFFSLLVEPLKKSRAIDIKVELFDAYSDYQYTKSFLFENIDVILLDGIFLLKKEFRKHHDYSIWIECSFSTAWARALSRNQEKTSEDQIKYLYNFIYFPAQRIHLYRDTPLKFADQIIYNKWPNE